MTKSLMLASAVAALTMVAGAAGAQSEPPAQSTPPAALSTPTEPPLCTDRPTKANGTCAVPAGDFQIESDALTWTRSSADGVTTATTQFTNPTFKYGLRSDLDLEVNWSPWTQVRTTVGGRTTTASGVGDVVVRGKWEPIGGDAFSLALIPYVKLPTASHNVGNGHVEGGLIAPMAWTLPAKVSLTLGPELDALENADGTGAHLNVVNLISLGRPFGDRWTLYAELWNAQDFEPTGTIAQTTADVAASYLLTKTLQLDAGANFGLNRAAPQQQYYFGVSHRF